MHHAHHAHHAIKALVLSFNIGVSATLEGYGMLKVAGKSEGLSTLRRALSGRFDNGGPSDDAVEAPRAVAEPA